MSKHWITAQFGAREFYSIPQILNHLGLLKVGFTDIWCENEILRKLSPKFKSRYLESLRGKMLNNSLETIFQMQIKNDAELSFDNFVASNLKKIISKESVFYTYSYSSLKKIETAKEMGAKIVYGQINPGLLEADLVKKLYLENFPTEKPEVPTDTYWRNWEKELALTDTIIVNSEWSKKLIIEFGVDEKKVEVIPLIYDKKELNFTRNFPFKFDSNRKLSLLYLGAMSVRKGFHVLLDAMEELLDLPIELNVVGRVNGPFDTSKFPSNILYHGAVSPVEIDAFYKNSDVFILPTFSDGFALTQLEAQNYKMPVITTPFCGEVIVNQENGFVLENISKESLIQSILSYYNDPSMVEKHSRNSNNLESFSQNSISNKFKSLNAKLATL